MTFFELEAHEKKQRIVLTFLYLIAVATVVVATIFFSTLILSILADSSENYLSLTDRLTPTLIAWSSFITLGIVGWANYYKFNALNQPTEYLAKALEAIALPKYKHSRLTKQLQNVNEELSIAFGVPLPQLYIIDEPMINALCTGTKLNDTAIFVTKGALDLLSRTELQALIAHEFAHIEHGDMRFNNYATALLHGVIVIGFIGEVLLKSAWNTHTKSDSGSKGKGFIILFGLAFYSTGFVGKLLGNAIQAGISRSRERMADADALHTTKHPEAMVTLFQKVGGLSLKPLPRVAGAASFGHYFFHNVTDSFNNFATHPSISRRILSIDKNWDGSFIESKVLSEDARRKQDNYEASKLYKESQKKVMLETILTTTSLPEDERLSKSQNLLQSLPKNVKTALQTIASSRDLLLAVLLRYQKGYQGLALNPRVTILIETLKEVPRKHYITLILLSSPQLRELTEKEAQEFYLYLKKQIESDKQVTLFEYSLLSVIKHLLPLPKEKISATLKKQECISNLFSLLIQLDIREDLEAQTAFNTLVKKKYLNSHYKKRRELNLKVFTQSVESLSHHRPQDKESYLKLALHIIQANKEVSTVEYELIQALRASFNLPIPL